jgi:hypothetical protein
MPNITMLDIDELKKTGSSPTSKSVLRIARRTPGVHAMMSHNIDLCEAMFIAWDTEFNTGRVSHKLKETWSSARSSHFTMGCRLSCARCAQSL